MCTRPHPATLQVRARSSTLTRIQLSYDIAGRSGTSYDVFSRRITRHAVDLASPFVLDKNSIFTANMSIVAEIGNVSKPYR